MKWFRLMLAGLFFFCVITGDAFGFSHPQHQADILEILFNAGKDPVFKELASFVSQGVDFGAGGKPISLSDPGSSFLNTVRHEFGNLKHLGKHRAWAHWTLNGNIPKEMLEQFRFRYGAAGGDRLVSLWSEFVTTRREAFRIAFQLKGPAADRVAQSLASFVSDIHILGDYTTKEAADLIPLSRVIDDMRKSIDRILGNHNTYSKLVFDQIKELPLTLTDAERANRIRAILKEHSALLKQKLDNILSRYGYSGKPVPFFETLKKVCRKAFEKSKPISIRPSKKSKIIKDVAKTNKLPAKNVRLRPGCLQTLKSAAGKTVHVLTVSLGKAAGTGLGEGVATFVFSQGFTYAMYQTGNIDETEFVKQTEQNCGSALVSGSATFVTVAIGTMAGVGSLGIGVAVLGVGIAADHLYRMADEEIRWVRSFNFEDDWVFGDLPTGLQNRRAVFESKAKDFLFVPVKDRPGVFQAMGNRRAVFEPLPGRPGIFEPADSRRPAVFEKPF